MMNARTLRQIFVVLRKELKDSLRDGRALFSIVFTIVMGPALIGFMMNRAADRQREAEEVEIPVVGQEHAPALVDWLGQQSGVQIVDGPGNPEQAVRDGQQDIVLIITQQFAERFRASRPATVKVVSDSSRNVARAKIERVRRLLQQYGSEIGGLRLIARGVSPSAMMPLQVEEVEVSTAQQRAAQVLAFIPMFIILAAFVGGMQIATDSTAGERERGSLEPLLELARAWAGLPQKPRRSALFVAVLSFFAFQSGGGVMPPGARLMKQVIEFVPWASAATVWLLLRRPTLLRSPWPWAVSAFCLVILVSAAQTTNMNSSATPSMSRYALMLVPLAIPLLLSAQRGLGRRWESVLLPLTAVSVVFALWNYHPRLSVRYLRPTLLAAFLWSIDRLIQRAASGAMQPSGLATRRCAACAASRSGTETAPMPSIRRPNGLHSPSTRRTAWVCGRARAPAEIRRAREPPGRSGDRRRAAFAQGS